MRKLTANEAVATGFDFSAVGNIHKSGSVRGMQRLYGWPKRGQVRVGSYIYNVGEAQVRRFPTHYAEVRA